MKEKEKAVFFSKKVKKIAIVRYREI